jgi:NADP-dependent 3-hydroxy acid dehydrogenase YdfG
VSDRPLAGTSALVTGATRGIGAAVARRLAGAGAELHLLARSHEALDAAARELGGCAWPADLEDAEQLAGVLERLAQSRGEPPDVVVNAAGVFEMAPLAETPLALFDRALGANLRGPFVVIRTLLSGMLRRGSGTIVSVGSVAGHRAFPSNGAYSASKFGLRGMHEVLAEELRGTGVRATLIEPAATDTSVWDPYRPDERPDLPDRADMLSPADVAEAVLFAVTRPAGVTLPLLRIQRD